MVQDGESIKEEGMLKQIVHGYVEGVCQSSQRLGGAGALSCLDLGKVNSIDSSGSGQLALSHSPVAPVHPDRVLPGQEPVHDFGGEGLSPHRSGCQLAIGYPEMQVCARSVWLGREQIVVGATK